MNEQMFTSNIIRSLNNVEGVKAIKIPDAPIFEGQKTRFGIKKPYDMTVDMYGRYVAIENKYMTGYKKFNKNQLIRVGTKGSVNNQIENLLEHKYCFVFLNVYVHRMFNRLYIFDKKIIKYIRDVGSLDKREIASLPAIECRKKFFEMTPWCRKWKEETMGSWEMLNTDHIEDMPDIKKITKEEFEKLF